MLLLLLLAAASAPCRRPLELGSDDRVFVTVDDAVEGPFAKAPLVRGGARQTATCVVQQSAKRGRRKSGFEREVMMLLLLLLLLLLRNLGRGEPAEGGEGRRRRKESHCCATVHPTRDAQHALLDVYRWCLWLQAVAAGLR